MSNLKVGDLVMIGGAASAEDRAKNAGRFRTVVGFVPAGFKIQNRDGSISIIKSNNAVLDGVLWNQIIAGPNVGSWVEDEYKTIVDLVKINPGGAEDETLTWVGKPNKQAESDKEPV